MEEDAAELTTKQAATLARVSPRTIREWHDAEKIRGRKTSAGLMVERRSLEEHLRTRGGTSADPSAAGGTASADVAALAREALEVLREELAANRAERQRLADEVERLSGQVGFLQGEVRQKDAQILQLTPGAAEPPRDTSAVVLVREIIAAEPRVEPPPSAEPVAEVDPPWWVRLRRWWARGGY